MRSKKVGFAILECLIAFGIAGCGGSSGPTPLVVTLAPPSASIAVNSSVDVVLQNPTDLPKYTSSVSWSIQEYGSSTSCLEVAVGLPSDAPPLPNCPFGWLATPNPQTGYSPLDGYYFAPSTATTAHVVADVKIYTDIHGSTIKSQGSATSVVSVTSQ